MSTKLMDELYAKILKGYKKSLHVFSKTRKQEKHCLKSGAKISGGCEGKIAQFAGQLDLTAGQ